MLQAPTRLDPMEPLTPDRDRFIALGDLDAQAAALGHQPDEGVALLAEATQAGEAADGEVLAGGEQRALGLAVEPLVLAPGQDGAVFEGHVGCVGHTRSLPWG